MQLHCKCFFKLFLFSYFDQISAILSTVSPHDHSALGTGVDFYKDGIILEAQFSNYPFFINNIVRSEVLFRDRIKLSCCAVKGLIVITKSGLFQASNSTLYYEQATQQMDFISKHNLISLPIGVMGIFAELGKIKAIWNQYKDPRYSRDSVAQDIVQFEVSLNKTAKRYKIEKVK